MSLDTYLFLRTPVSAAALAASLVDEHGLEPDGDWLGGNLAGLILMPWTGGRTGLD